MKVLIALLLTSAVWGQAPPPPPPPTPPQVLRVFEIKNADVNRLAAIIDVFGAKLRPDPALKVISVSGTSEQVQAIEDAIKRYDVPPPAQKNVELTFHLLLAGPAGVAVKLPAELDPVIKQLRATFPYQGYRLADTLQVRARDGDGFDANSTADFSSTTAGAPSSMTQLRVQKVTIGVTDRVPMIRVDVLRLSMRVPYCISPAVTPCQFQFTESGLNTSIDIREGQKVVVGKTAVGSDSAIIVVVTAKVVD